MDLVILDPKLRSALIQKRRRSGLDRRDEVWNGVYVMSPGANNEHQDIGAGLTICFGMVVSQPGSGKVQAGANISDRATHWKRNYRCPDVLVFLNGTTARNKKTHWLGGPDFAVEIVSRHDRSREKVDFYVKVNTRELLIVDRYPWALELYRLGDEGAFEMVGRSTIEQPVILESRVLPLTFQLGSGQERPAIMVKHADGVQAWSA